MNHEVDMGRDVYSIQGTQIVLICIHTEAVTVAFPQGLVQGLVGFDQVQGGVALHSQAQRTFV